MSSNTVARSTILKSHPEFGKDKLEQKWKYIWGKRVQVHTHSTHTHLRLVVLVLVQLGNLYNMQPNGK